MNALREKRKEEKYQRGVQVRQQLEEKETAQKAAIIRSLEVSTKRVYKVRM